MIRIKTALLVSGILTLSVILSSCDSKQKTDVKQTAQSFINRVKDTFTKNNLAQTPMKTQKKVRFTPKTKADPFAAVIAQKAINNDNTVLKNTALTAIKLVGLIHRDDKQWAIVTAPKSKLYALKKGDHVGKQNALVTKVDSHQLVLDTSALGTPSKLTLTLQESPNDS
jgi:Tfp pilus assembly protein PilP